MYTVNKIYKSGYPIDFSNSSTYVLSKYSICYDKRVREFNVSSQTGPLLRCAALPSAAYPSCLLTSGMSGVISLWDLRVSAWQRPQLKFSHSELKASVSACL
ncbi:unnamed protein product [Trichobilharzia regenti]|nr:unnamed protein product [Trichobilharzia regenti]